VNPNGTLVLTREEVSELLTTRECIEAVEEAFALYGKGGIDPPGILGVHAIGGGFHVKAGILPLRARYFAAKINANFPANRERYRLPTIQGVVVLCDADSGYPLAILDSIEITVKRTAAATAVAARHLARPDAKVALICGCGGQAGAQLDALAAVRALERAYLYDLDPERARNLARELSPALDFELVPTTNLDDALGASDAIVTCTTATRAFIEKDAVPRGAFLAAVGADSPVKQEIDPALLRSATLVVDVRSQCIEIGELHHAPDARVHAELAEVVAGTRPGRSSDEEILVFDSTGMALQDVAAAARVYERALTTERGVRVKLVD
jgi:ornithine cyclodeaminase/alanine dehydrogenase-like protein (mu-crystallin family)